jgi:hypothetical protein
MTPAERFARLFQGYNRAHGLWHQGKVATDGKRGGRYITAVGPATLAHYQRHLNGELSLGAIMLRDDDTVLFGAIDYDDRSCNHAELEAKIRALKLPLLVCISKSRGAHLYCFLAEPAPASLLRDALSRYRSLLGMAATTEIFPKQTCRLDENDRGSFINLPYLHAEATERPAVIDGVPTSLEVFLGAAEAARVLPERLERGAELGDERFAGGPPCLQVIAAQGGFSSGCRNNGMTGVAVYLQKRFPEAWREKIYEYNTQLAQLPVEEVQGIVKSHSRKEYNYQCKLAPLNSHCDRAACISREFGVGNAGDVLITGVTRYKAGTTSAYAVEIAGQRMWVDPAVLANRDAFNRQCMHQIGRLPIHLKPGEWQLKVDRLLQDADVVEDPEDASPDGQLWEWIEQFLTQQVHAITREEIWLGKVYRDGDGRSYFRSKDLFKYLSDRRVKFEGEHAVWALLRSRKADTAMWKLSGKQIRLWHVPTPEMPGAGVMFLESTEKEIF